MVSVEAKHNWDSDEGPFELLKCLKSCGDGKYLARVVDRDLQEEYGTDRVILTIPLRGRRRLRPSIVASEVLRPSLKPGNCANIVRCFGVEFFHGAPVIVTEYVPWINLREILGRPGKGKRLPVTDALGIMQHVLKGLTVVHRARIFHRDIRPENILVCGDSAKIDGFALARFLEPDELDEGLTGSLYYMSPETLREEGASFPSDIWSVGVTFYETLTGRFPFGGNDMPIGVLADQIQRRQHKPVCEVCPDIPVELSRIVDRALEKEPAKRFASAGEMCEALGDFQCRHAAGAGKLPSTGLDR